MVTFDEWYIKNIFPIQETMNWTFPDIARMSWQASEQEAIKKVLGILEKDLRPLEVVQHDYFDVNDAIAKKYIEEIKAAFGIQEEK